MAPAVPFALLGVVQLTAVAMWLGFAGAVCLPPRVAAKEGDAVRIAIAGHGINTAQLLDLLSDLSQADGPETRWIGEFGLGLGFVGRVAQQLGLRLRVASPSGSGAEFSFDVPVA